MVSQAAWIRSLMATFVKTWEGRGITIGGLFGAQLGRHEEVLAWSRAQQAAFLIYMGQCVREAIQNCKERWAKNLRELAARGKDGKSTEDPAFYGPFSLLSADQGIRGLLSVTNDICYVRAKEMKLQDWVSETGAGASDEEAVRVALRTLKTQPMANFLKEIAEGLSGYDWRSSSVPGLTETERIRKAAFRGSGGYRELRQELLKQLANERRAIGKAANEVLHALGYDK
jgi:hypothetical protein